MVKKKSYIPSRREIVWLDFNPQSGHEQSGRRPAVVVSPVEYNRKSGLALFCPITSQKKDYPFEVELPLHGVIKGVILSDQLKSLDWKARNVEFIESVSDETINDVIAKVRVLL